MRDTYILIAQFNQRQNQKIFELLDQLSDAQRKADMKGLHNGSMHGAMDRILDTEIFTLNIMCGAKSVDIPKLAAPYVVAPDPNHMPGAHGAGEMPPEGAPAPAPVVHDFSIKFENYEDLKRAFETVDRVYVEIYKTMDDSDLTTDGPVPHSEMLKAMFMGNLMRGQVTQLLNECGIHSDLIAGPLLG